MLIFHPIQLQIFITHSHSPISHQSVFCYSLQSLTSFFFQRSRATPLQLWVESTACGQGAARIPFILIIHPSVRRLFFIWPEQSGPRPDLHCTWVMHSGDCEYNIHVRARRVRELPLAAPCGHRTLFLAAPDNQFTTTECKLKHNWSLYVCVYVSGWARACAIDPGRCDVDSSQIMCVSSFFTQQGRIQPHNKTLKMSQTYLKQNTFFKFYNFQYIIAYQIFKHFTFLTISIYINLQ